MKGYVVIIEGERPKFTRDRDKAIAYIRQIYAETRERAGADYDEFWTKVENELIETGYISNVSFTVNDLFLEVEELE